MANEFVHLHVHSEYSLLDGLCKIDDLVETTKAQGGKAIALTDHGVMYGVIEFYKKAKKEGVKPIIGCELYMAEEDCKKKKRRDAYHLTVWARNKQGYENLMEIVSIGHLEGFYYKPRVDMKILSEHSEGLMAASGCPTGLVPKQLLNESYTKARKTTSKLAEIFGEDNFYLELQRHPYVEMAKADGLPEKIVRDIEKMDEEQKAIENGLVKLSKDLGLPVLATNDVHYVQKEDAVAQDAVVCIQTGKVIDEVNRMRYIDTPDFYLKTAEQMGKIFADMPQAVENSVKIAEKVDVELKLGEWFFPNFDLPEGKTAGEALRDMAYKGAEEKLEGVDKEVEERLDYELKIIDGKGYSPYFLIFADMTRYAAESGIFVNTRGSAAGSLVSYCCGITTVDPLRYHLPFERFLNPFRPSPPDIDLDISDDRRDEMIDYLKEKYGEEKVAQICTFGTMKAKAAVRDVGRVMGMPYSQPDRVSKMIPPGSQGFPMTLDKALGESGELKSAYESEKETKKLIDMAKKIEGNVRHISVHAAAVVASPSKMTNFSPLQTEPGGGDKVITQYEMHGCEDVGLIKLDILGIRNLSIMANAIKLIEKLRDEEIDLYDIPLDDEKTFSMLTEGRTFGVFQMASSGVTKYLMDLQPERIEDLMQMVALYRPGPMAFIPEYIKRKHNPELIEYMDPRMEDFLQSSYGVIVYQDDVLYCALELAGYDWGEADKFRKAIGKKIPEEMEKQKGKFIKGAIDNGMEPKKAKELFARIETFAAYGFNKCVTGDTVVYLSDQCRPVMVEGLYQQKIVDTDSVLGLGGNGKISDQRVRIVKRNGEKNVYKLTTKLGKGIKATDNHPFLTVSGYRELGELSKGDKLAIVRKLPNDEIDREVFWDEIVSIEPVGKEMTYDLTLENDHNFLANDFVVHNSHAASYGMVSYWTAYLKANYPVEYMTALLTAEAGNTDKLVEAIDECEQMGIKILPPDVNQSLTAFTIVDHENGENERVIRFGLSAIKNVGEAAIEAILSERKEGDFKSLADFCVRVDARKVNKKVLDSLIKSGAMDSYGSRASLVAGLETVRKGAKLAQKKKEAGQASLFGGVSDKDNPISIDDDLPEVEDWSKKKKLQFEKDLLGFYLSENPIKALVKKMEGVTTHQIKQLDPKHHVGQSVKVAGMITDVRRVHTKKGNKPMAFGELEDNTGSVDMVIFPSVFEQTKDYWEEDKLIFVEGKVDYRDDNLNLLINEVRLIENVEVPQGGVCKIRIPRGTKKSILRKISSVLRDNPGDDKVQIIVPNGGRPKILDVPFGVDYSEKLDTKVKELLK